jgi:hypothetical protein
MASSTSPGSLPALWCFGSFRLSKAFKIAAGGGEIFVAVADRHEAMSAMRREGATFLGWISTKTLY